MKKLKLRGLTVLRLSSSIETNMILSENPPKRNFLSPPGTKYPRNPREGGRQGFTIIELLLSIGLLTILLGVLTNFLLTTLDVQLRVTSLSNVEQDARYLALRLEYDVRRATSMTIPAIDGQTDTSTTLLIDGSSHTFSIQNGSLTLTSPAGTDALTSAEVTITSFSVMRVGNTGNGDTLRFQYTLASGTETKDYQTSVGLR